MIIHSLKTGETLKDLGELDQRSSDPIWIDLPYPTLELDPDENKDVEELSNYTKIEIDDLKDCLDLNERSRFDDDDEGYFFIILRVPTEAPVVEERRITVPLGIFWDFGHQWIATVHTDYIRLPLGVRKSKRKARFRMDIFNFLISILDSVVWSYELALDDLDDDLDSLEKNITRRKRSKQISKIFQLSKRTAYLHAALRSNVTALSEAKRHKQFLVTEDDKDKWDDVENDAYQQVEMVSLYKELLSSSLNAHSNSISNELADVMKLMTSISLILMLPTLIGTFYGMNVDLPFMHEPLSFWLLVLFSAVLSVAAIAVLRWLNWL